MLAFGQQPGQRTAQQRLPLTSTSLGAHVHFVQRSEEQERMGCKVYSCPFLQAGGDVSGGLHPVHKAGACGLYVLQLYSCSLLQAGGDVSGGLHPI